MSNPVIISPEVISEIAKSIVDAIDNMDWDKVIDKMTPTNPEAEWRTYTTVPHGASITRYFYCSACGRQISYRVWGNTNKPTKEEFLADYPYCHCGAKMKIGV